MDNEKIIQLWDELSDFAAHKSDHAVTHCMNTICEMIDADKAFWIGGVRVMKGPQAHEDPMAGWRIGAVHLLNADAGALQRKAEALKTAQVNEPGEATTNLIANAGEFRAHTLQSGTLLDIDSFKQTDHYDYFYRQANISDRIWVVTPVSDDAESYFVFDSCTNGKVFTTHELQLAAKSLRGIKWFHRQLLLSHGLGITSEPLTKAERRVKQQLLSGDSERDIGLKLALSPGTVHQYAVRIYRKFGVKGRTEFMSLWLHGRL